MACYYRPEHSEVMFEYPKAVEFLTIDESNRLRLKLEEEKTRNEQALQRLTSEIDSIKEAMIKVLAKGEIKPL
jgi:hypothetical protein